MFLRIVGKQTIRGHVAEYNGRILPDNIVNLYVLYAAGSESTL
jgi:hypothetical protein